MFDVYDFVFELKKLMENEEVYNKEDDSITVKVDAKLFDFKIKS